MDFTARLRQMLLQMIPFLMAIVFHEVGHAFVAKRHGDKTAEELGRLTLNPLPHLDPIGTVLFPMINMLTGIPFMFGWAKPVPINYGKLKPYRRGLFLVSLAGPVTNLILAFGAALMLVGMATFIPKTFYLFEPFIAMANFGIGINLALALFNLIPLPPLDGSRMVEAFLSVEQARKLEGMQTYSFFILMALLWSGGLNFILGGPVVFLSELFVNIWAFVFLKTGLLGA